MFFFLPTQTDKPQGMRYENILNKRLTKHLIEVNTHKKGNTNRISEHLVTVYAQKNIYKTIFNFGLFRHSLQFNGKR